MYPSYAASFTVPPTRPSMSLLSNIQASCEAYCCSIPYIICLTIFICGFCRCIISEVYQAVLLVMYRSINHTTLLVMYSNHHSAYNSSSIPSTISNHLNHCQPQVTVPIWLYLQVTNTVPILHQPVIQQCQCNLNCSVLCHTMVTTSEGFTPMELLPGHNSMLLREQKKSLRLKSST